jgi:hypothetical protein
MLKFFTRFRNIQLEKWNELRFATISNKRQRIIALDMLRGIFLVTLIVNHIPWTPSLFSFITGRSELFASAAEGFFVVSGILVGYIYGQKIIGSPRPTFKRIWKRGFVLYILSVTGTLFFTLLALRFSSNIVGIEPWNGSIQSYLFNTFSLRYSYGWTDFLNRYALFMFAAPFALWLISRQKAWVVMGLSGLIWLVLRENVYFMPFSAWQLIFMFGLVIGYYLPQIEARAMRLSEYKKRIGFRVIVTTATLTYVLSVWWSVVIPFLAISLGADLPQAILSLFIKLAEYRTTIWDGWFSKQTLAPGRVLMGTLWFLALYLLIRVYESKVAYWKYGKMIEYLGKHSLFVYVTHGLVIVLVNILLSPPPGYQNILLNTVVVTIVLWSVYELTNRRELFDHLITRTRHRINREDF